MTSHPDSTERLRRAFADTAEDSGQQAVDDARVWQAVRGELNVEERQAMVEEMAQNPALAESWRIAQALNAELGEATAAKPSNVIRVPQGRWRPWTQGLLAAAAMVVLAIGIGRWQGGFEDGNSTGPPVYRAAEQPQVVSRLDEAEALPRDDFTLAWSAIDGATYKVTVLRQDWTVVVVAADLETAEFQVPSEALVDLPAGSQLLWQVEARLADGPSVASDTFFARLD